MNSICDRFTMKEERMFAKWNNGTQSVCRVLGDLPNSNIKFAMQFMHVEVNLVFQHWLYELRKQYILPLFNPHLINIEL